MKSKLFLILILAGLILTAPGISRAQPPPLIISIDFEKKFPVGDWSPLGEWEHTFEIVSGEDSGIGDIGVIDIVDHDPNNPGQSVDIKILAGTITLWDNVPLGQEQDLARIEKGLLGFKIAATAKIQLGAAGPGIFKLQNPLKAETFQELVANIIDFVWVISIAVAPLMLLIAGFLFLTAAGDPARLTMARKMIFWTVIGFAIVALAEGLIAMLRGILGG